MNEFNGKRVWVTGAGSGLGLALVEQLLDQGARVAASGRASEYLQGLSLQYPENLLLLDSNLTEPREAQAAARQIADRWSALECLIINTGTCDYLAVDTPSAAIFESIVSSNLSASRQCLDSALALLQRADSPHVVGILSRYSALQLSAPGQPASVGNSVMQLLSEQRADLAAQAIDLTLIAPLDLQVAQPPEQVTPEQWTAHTAAEVILKHVPERPASLILEALHLNNLWPLPR